MFEPPRLARSPELMSRDDTTLLVIDVQEKLVRAMPRAARLVWNIGRLIDGARLLGVVVAGTEQYPRGLGPTVPALADRLGPLPEKLSFSVAGCEPLVRQLAAASRPHILVCGIEAHVCVQQSVLDLLHAGYRVSVAADAVESRSDEDRTTALRRLEASGATLTTVEAALFEWCAAAGTSEFKALSQLVKSTFPPETPS